jgi:hypothetical protein
MEMVGNNHCMAKTVLPRNIPTASPDAAAEAREQADAYDSLFASHELELEGGDTITIPPHPDFGMLDDEQLEAYEELLFEVDTEYDREESIYIPEQRLDNGVVLPASEQPGQLKRPYRKEGVLVKPPHSVRVVKAALGEAEYKRLRDGGRSAADVWKIWGKQGMEVQERQSADPKSKGGTVDLAAVPEADSQ